MQNGTDTREDPGLDDLRRLPFQPFDLSVGGTRYTATHPRDATGAPRTDRLRLTLGTAELELTAAGDEPRAVRPAPGMEAALGPAVAALRRDLGWLMGPPPDKTAAPLALRAWMVAARWMPLPLYLAYGAVHLAQGAALRRLPERLGISAPPATDRPLIWIHAASLGEVAQLATLVPALRSALSAGIVVTTGTRSGADWVDRNLPGVVHRFVPVDSAGAWRRFLDRVRPDLGVILENDIWPMMIHQARHHGLPMMMLGVRPSGSRRRHPELYGHLMRGCDLIGCRSVEVAREVYGLGVPIPKIRITGDLKAIAGPLAANEADLQGLRAAIGTRDAWIAASTHEADEDAVLDAHVALRRTGDTLLVWAPRHPRRARDILRKAEARGLSVAQRSRDQKIRPDSAVYLADTLGEMGTMFRTADVVFLGGSFGDEGGHNPFEPARLGRALVTGPKTANFDETMAAFSARGALVRVTDAAALATAVRRLLDGGAAEAGARAAVIAAEADGRLDDVVRAIRDLLSDPTHRGDAAHPTAAPRRPDQT